MNDSTGTVVIVRERGGAAGVRAAAGNSLAYSGLWVTGAVVIGSLLAMTEADPSHPPQMPPIAVLLAVCGLSPVIEEMLFRGALQPLIRDALSSRRPDPAIPRHGDSHIANFVTSVIFAACHGIHHELNLTVLSGLLVASGTLGFLKDRGVELSVLVFIHAIWNFAFLMAIPTKLTM